MEKFWKMLEFLDLKLCVRVKLRRRHGSVSYSVIGHIQTDITWMELQFDKRVVHYRSSLQETNQYSTLINFDLQIGTTD